MNTLNNLLDNARKVCASDSRIADKLKVSRSAVSLWRSGGKINPEHLARLIELANADPALAVQVMAEQDATGAGSRVWADVAKRLGAAAAVVLAVALPYQGAGAVANVQAEQQAAMYIMRSWIRRLVARLATIGRRQGVGYASPLLA